MSENNLPAAPAHEGVSRRTVTKAMAWSVPAVAVAGAAPAFAASLLPCVGQITPTGGTYPVTVSLSGCDTSNSHWDFNIQLRVDAQQGTECDCDKFRVTFYDAPKRSRLWIQGGNVEPGGGGWTGRTANDPRLYVQKELSPGVPGTFPQQGDAVYRVAGPSPYNGYDTPGTFNGTITAHGTANDSLHTLINPSGGALPCSASGPMAYYKLECGKNGQWTPLGDGNPGTINICVPMIQATVCRFDTTGNDRYRMNITVLNSCGIPNSNFVVTNVQRNNDTNFPDEGSSVWSGNQVVGAGTTVQMTGTGSGDQLWITFTTDGGANESIIRVPVNNTSCN